MAEIAGLSLAANIFQFVEYGIKFVDTAWKIYGSGTNALDTFRDLQKLSRDLESVTQRLETQNPCSWGQSSDGNVYRGQTLKDITKECRATSQEMLASLTDIGLFPYRKPRKRDAMRTAFKLRWSEDSIRALAKRLESCRSQLILVIVAALRYSQPEFLSIFFEHLLITITARTHPLHKIGRKA